MISSVNDHNVFTTDTVDFNTVLLDNECSCSILSNIKLFIPGTLVKLDTPILMRGAGGIFEVWFQGQTKSFGPALFSETVPCQILSFYTVTKKYRVEWLQSEQTMRVHMSEHDHLDFMATEASKMYLHKFSDKFIQQLSNRIADPSFPCCTDSLPETEHDKMKNLLPPFILRITVLLKQLHKTSLIIRNKKYNMLMTLYNYSVNWHLHPIEIYMTLYHMESSLTLL